MPKLIDEKRLFRAFAQRDVVPMHKRGSPLRRSSTGAIVLHNMFKNLAPVAPSMEDQIGELFAVTIANREKQAHRGPVH
jgi:hypothetical protein